MKKHNGFGNFPEEFTAYQKANAVILPVPFDATSTWGKGSDKGPEAIIRASANMEFYDIEQDEEIYQKIGIFTDIPINERKSPEKLYMAVRARTAGHLRQQKTVICLGGEHSISIGAARAYADQYPGLSVLQFDAHTDLRDEYHGSKYNHACVMARIKEFAPIVQAGIRSMDLSEKQNLDPSRVFWAKDIYNLRDWFDQAINLLSETVYVTIDLDVLDISIMPATGTPEPGGLYWYDLLAFLKKLCLKKRVVGFDIVELCPHPRSQPADFLAAKLVYSFLGYMFIKK